MAVTYWHMFKKKITTLQVAIEIMTISREKSDAMLSGLEEELVKVEGQFRILDRNRAILDATLVIIAGELRIAKNLLKQNISDAVYHDVIDSLDDDATGRYCKQEILNYTNAYDKALSQGGNPMSGVSSWFLYRLTGNNEDMFTTAGVLDMVPDLIAMTYLVDSMSVVKNISSKYKIQRA